jgi:hypothetical protein
VNVLEALLSRGYFPKELPPVFSTAGFAKAVTAASFDPSACLVAPNLKDHLDHPERGISRLCRHSLARLDGTNRLLHIPHPTHFYSLCTALDDGWAKVEARLRQSYLAISVPKPDPNSLRAFIPTEPGSSRPTRRVRDRAGGDFLVIADVANFYGTIYTHSIPWALHTKNVAKKNRRDSSLLGNVIDGYVRNGQDGQTVGLPAGPDTSFLIGEMILTAVDLQLRQRHPSLIGFRFYDDYELVCRDETAAREVLACVQSCLSEYELSLNQRKAKIVRLPCEIDHTWLTTLRQLKLSDTVKQDEFIDFVNTVFPLARDYPNDPVLRYALVRLVSGHKIGDVWDAYQNFLLQIYRSEPGLSHLVAGELLRHEWQDHPTDKQFLERAISDHISQYAATYATNEVVWALWLAIVFDVRLDASIADTVSSITDNLVAILALDARNRGLFRSSLDTSLWESKLTEDHIYSSDWLLSYEIAARDWLPIQDGSDYINKHPCFGALCRSGIRFYDEASYESKDSLIKRLEINIDLYGV